MNRLPLSLVLYLTGFALIAGGAGVIAGLSSPGPGIPILGAGLLIFFIGSIFAHLDQTRGNKR